jgi:hypothetical protein
MPIFKSIGCDCVEEKVRFELTVPFRTSVFKTDAIDHSAISPDMVPPAGIEPAKPDYKTGILPLN